MKKLLCMWMVVCGLLLIPGNMKGQSLKDILNSSAVKNAVTSVTGGKAVTFENLQGTWMYGRRPMLYGHSLTPLSP